MQSCPLVLLCLLLCTCEALEIYIIRHGARSPTKDDFQEIFGVLKGELTAEGRSQAYYYGKELRIRHRKVQSHELMVYASKSNRTVESANYFLHGWNGLKSRENGTQFKANPKYLPPCSLSYQPRSDRAFVKVRAYPNQLTVVKDELVRGSRCFPKEGYSSKSLYENYLWRRMSSSQACTKFNVWKKGICSGSKDYKKLTKDFLTMQDTHRCLAYIGIHVPMINNEEVELMRLVKNNYDLRKVQDEPKLIASVTSTLAFFQDLAANSSFQVVVLFTHDTHQIPLMKVLLGDQQFIEEFDKETRVPFLNAIHLSIQEDEVRLFMNDKEMAMKECKHNSNTCTYSNLLERLKKYRQPLSEVCKAGKPHE